MRYLIRHETRLAFASPVREHQCELRLVPRAHPHQTILRADVEVEPAADLLTFTDCYRNVVHAFSLIEPHDALVTRLDAEVETTLANPFDYSPVLPTRERAWIADALRAEPRLYDFVLSRSAATPALPASSGDLQFPAHDWSRPVLEAVQDAAEWIREVLTYDPEATRVHAALAEVLARRAGVCQDFTHLLIAIVRGWGVPARYIAGYQDAANDRFDAAQATHAWAEVLIPGAGWRGFDVTNGLVTNDHYVCVAIGRDSRDAAPQRGSMKGDESGGVPAVMLQVQRQQ
jgi:transglutaminase-like putative cysteine protease